MGPTRPAQPYSRLPPAVSSDTEEKGEKGGIGAPRWAPGRNGAPRGAAPYHAAMPSPTDSSSVVRWFTDRLRWVLLGVGGAVVAGLVVWLVLLVLRRPSSPVPTSGTWESVSTDGRDLVDGTTIRLTFTQNLLSVYAGCNNLGGTVFVDGARLYWSEDASTEVGCSPGLAAQDTWLAGWLNAGVDVFRDGKSLVLAGAGVRVTFVSTGDD